MFMFARCRLARGDVRSVAFATTVGVEAALLQERVVGVGERGGALRRSPTRLDLHAAVARRRSRGRSPSRARPPRRRGSASGTRRGARRRWRRPAWLSSNGRGLNVRSKYSSGCRISRVVRGGFAWTRSSSFQPPRRYAAMTNFRPSRYGNFSISAKYFGVDGIDHLLRLRGRGDHARAWRRPSRPRRARRPTSSSMCATITSTASPSSTRVVGEVGVGVAHQRLSFAPSSKCWSCSACVSSWTIDRLFEQSSDRRAWPLPAAASGSWRME